MAGEAATITNTAVILGTTYVSDGSVTTNAAVPFSQSVAAAKTGQLTTRTDADTGTLTMSGGHGITTGARLDIYWSGGSRYGVTVGTVSVNSVPFDGGAGDDLPANLTAVTAMVPTAQTVTVTGDNVKVIRVRNPGRNNPATFAFTQGDDTAIVAYRPAVATASNPTAAGWASTDGSDNPVAGVTVGKVYLSHGDSTQSLTLDGVVMYN